MEGLAVLISPLIAFLVIGLFGSRLGDMASAVLCVLGGAFSFLFSLWTTSESEPFTIELYNFLPLQNYTLTLGLYFDPLLLNHSLCGHLVATLIFVYSIGYMHNLFGQWAFKFYAYLSFFLLPCSL
ncbi:MAG: hypothetical protein ABDH29_01515 [Aquificaceae bacterium]